MNEPADASLIRRLWPFARPDVALFVAALAAAPVGTALALAQPWLLKHAIDDGIVAGDAATAGRLALGYLAAAAGAYLVQAATAIALALAGQRTLVRLRGAIYQHLMTRSAAFFDRRPAGMLLTRATSDVEALGEAISSGVVTIVLDVLTIVGVIVVMFVLDWRLTLVLLAAGPPLAAVLQLCRLQLRHHFQLARDGLASVNAYLAERLAGVELVQLYNHEERTLRAFEARNAAYRDATIRSNVWDALMFAVVDGVGSMTTALLLWAGVSPWVQDWGTGVVTAGLLAAFIDMIDRLFAPLREFSNKISILQRAVTGLAKVVDVLDSTEAIGPGAPLAGPARGSIRLDDVRFAYPPSQPGAEAQDVLHGVSLRVEPGEVVALVGSTGCGKTTVARLLTRTYDGYRGSITLDGQELSGLDPAGVRRAVAMVRQDVHIFPDTVRFNVSMGHPVDDVRLEQAARLVNAWHVIEALPGGWDAVLRERGANLSAGQGQLLTFARTMAYDPPVVVLDEATASVDPVTETLIRDATVRLLQRKTVIVIAHRLSTIAAADRIVVLHRGKVLEEGDHATLLAREGRYAELVRAGQGE